MAVGKELFNPPKATLEVTLPTPGVLVQPNDVQREGLRSHNFMNREFASLWEGFLDYNCNPSDDCRTNRLAQSSIDELIISGRDKRMLNVFV
jgi:hypothetical protein